MNMPSQDADKKVDRVRQEPRLPPGQLQTQKWPVLHYGSVPRIDLAKWSLRVDGLVEQPQHWTWAEFQALPRVQVYSDIHCVTRWSRFDNLWEGVALKEVLRRAQPEASGRFAVMLGSSCRTEPAAALRGFGAARFPSAACLSVKARNPSSGMKTSPRTSRRLGGRSLGCSLSESGMARIVRRFGVMSSPRSPSPRVAPRV